MSPIRYNYTKRCRKLKRPVNGRTHTLKKYGGFVAIRKGQFGYDAAAYEESIHFIAITIPL